MKRAVCRFLRLLRPLLVVAAIITWVVGYASQPHATASLGKTKTEIPAADAPERPRIGNSIAEKPRLQPARQVLVCDPSGKPPQTMAVAQLRKSARLSR